MMEMKIKIEVPDLAAAIEKLAASLANSTFETPAAVTAAAPINSTPATPAPVPAAPQEVQAVPMAAPVAPAPTANPVPVAPVQTAPAPAPAIPVTAPTYTLDQIAKAGASLVDAGKMEQLLGLLTKYGLQAVTQLVPDQYGAFATELRALGAQI